MGPTLLSLRVFRNLSEVGRVNEELDALWEAQELPEEGKMEILLCVEEALSNVIRHGTVTEPEDEVWVRASLGPGKIEIQVEDNGAAFDPLLHPPPVLDRTLEQRRTGGLGIHLVRQLMDHVSYERSGGRNILRMAKKIGISVET